MSTPSSDRTADGPRLARRTALAAGAALVSATAGCAGFLEDEEAAEPDTDPAADVPADATALARVETDAIASADEPDRVFEELAAAEPARLEAAATLEARTGLDPLAAAELLSFDVSESEGAADADAVIVDGDRTTDEAVAALESATDATYEAETVADEPVLYRPTDADGSGGDSSGATTEPPALGVLGDGRFVVGDAAAAEAALEVRYGNADAVGGRLRDAYDDARGGQVSVASAPSGSLLPEAVRTHPLVNGDVFEEIEAFARSYAVVDAGVALDAAFHVGEEGDAAELQQVLEGILPLLAEPETVSSIEGIDIDESDLEGFDPDEVEFDRDGAIVRLHYEGDADVLAVLDEV